MGTITATLTILPRPPLKTAEVQLPDRCPNCESDLRKSGAVIEHAWTKTVQACHLDGDQLEYKGRQACEDAVLVIGYECAACEVSIISADDVAAQQDAKVEQAESYLGEAAKLYRATVLDPQSGTLNEVMVPVGQVVPGQQVREVVCKNKVLEEFLRSVSPDLLRDVTLIAGMPKEAQPAAIEKLLAQWRRKAEQGTAQIGLTGEIGAVDFLTVEVWVEQFEPVTS